MDSAVEAKRLRRSTTSSSSPLRAPLGNLIHRLGLPPPPRALARPPRTTRAASPAVGCGVLHPVTRKEGRLRRGMDSPPLGLGWWPCSSAAASTHAVAAIIDRRVRGRRLGRRRMGKILEVSAFLSPHTCSWPTKAVGSLELTHRFQ
jgi:hypothetical protein